MLPNNKLIRGAGCASAVRVTVMETGLLGVKCSESLRADLTSLQRS